jgi:hypothetical protein
MSQIKFSLSYKGTEGHLIDLYDVSQALIGFQRSLALTTHLILNDEIIIQAPSLKGARIYAAPARPSSWELTAVIAIVATGIYKLGTAPADSPLGHIVFSLYDYMISKTLGAHVDYKKSLGILYQEVKRKEINLPEIKESKIDSLIEKCSHAVIEMHRPIVMTETATHCVIAGSYADKERKLCAELTRDSYNSICGMIEKTSKIFEGYISSYNSNTYKGRIFIKEFGRPVAFELQPQARSSDKVQIITISLFHTALKQPKEPGGLIHIIAFEKRTKTGLLKSLIINNISGDPFSM